jgi:hypothetical protein
MESAFKGVSGLPKLLRPQQISTDVNTSQHISTLIRRPPYMGFAFLFGWGKAGLRGWDALQDGGKPLKDGFSPYNCTI